MSPLCRSSSRHVTVATAAPAFVLLTACASAPPPPPQQATASTTTTTSAEHADGVATPACELVCEGAEVVHRATETPDYHRAAVEDANRVFDAMHGDLLACYRARLAVNRDAHGFITVDVVVDPDGSVRSVDTTSGAFLGGAPLGDTATACVARRIKRATFAPVHGGGTLHLHVPFILRRTGEDTL